MTSEALATAPHEVQTWAQPGAAFGSRELTNTVAAQSDDDVLQFVNPDYLGMLFALDTWLEVLDRKKPDGIWNMLINTGMRQAEDRRAMVIDFGKGLTSCMVPIVGRIDPVVPDYPLGVRRFSSLEAATKTATAISEIHEDDIISIVRSVPTAWITDEAKERIVSELVERAPRVQSVCEQLHSTVPRWN